MLSKILNIQVFATESIEFVLGIRLVMIRLVILQLKTQVLWSKVKPWIGLITRKLNRVPRYKLSILYTNNCWFVLYYFNLL